MEEVFKFIANHYEVIISFGTLIISVVFFILKKKPVNDILTYIYDSAISAIITIEKSGIVGSSEKLKAAITIVKNCLQVRFPELDLNSYTHLIESTIEEILQTPQKKGE